MKSWIPRGTAALLSAMPFALPAQDASLTDDDIEEIIVTAQKRATSLQDVPFSVAALTAASSAYPAQTLAPNRPSPPCCPISRTN
jgi:outer membrane receptor protein involved in Fe transport